MGKRSTEKPRGADDGHGANKGNGRDPGRRGGNSRGRATKRASVPMDQEAEKIAQDLRLQQDELAGEVEELKRATVRNRDDLMRARADLENVRKRAEREIEKARRYGIEPLLRELLPVLDSMQLGLQSAAVETDLEAVREGLQMTLRLMRDTLGRFRVELIEPRPGTAFDPQLHEVVSTRAAEDGAPGQQVLEVLQCGCLLDGRLLRAAKVIISESPS